MRRSIKDINQLLQQNQFLSESTLNELKSDDRNGVQKALSKWLKEQEKQKELQLQFHEMRKFEEELYTQNITYIAGVDEVGRGPLAGPVVAAAVILPSSFQLLGLTDSKKVNQKNRERFYEIIYAEAISVGVGIVSSKEIDRINIYEATKVAMETAISELAYVPEHLLIDAMKLPLAIPQTAIIKGDSKSISIAASSIIAKVTRDRYMEKLATKFPNYGFEKHMGYGTKEHLRAIDEHGICEEHRLSFAPIRDRNMTTLFS